MTSTIVGLEKRVEYPESENRLLQQTNEEFLSQLLLLQKIPSGAKKSLLGSVPYEFIRIAVKAKNTIYKWYGKNVLEMAHYEMHIQRNWTSRVEPVMEKGLKCQEGLKNVLCLLFLLAS